MEQILVQVCAGNDCRDHGSLDLLSQVERLYADRQDIRVVDTGCQHYCEDGPVAIVNGEIFLRARIDVITAAVTGVIEGKTIGSAEESPLAAERDLPRTKD